MKPKEMKLNSCWALLLLLALPLTGWSQAAKRAEYGVNLTLAIYQYDDTRSKPIREVTPLKQTLSSAEQETDYLTRSFGLEDVKPRHVRSVGLQAGESFTEAQTLNERQLLITLTPRVVTREGVRFDLAARYAGQELLDLKEVAVNNYETVMVKGGRGDFGVREFMGPKGPESVPEKRSLLLTLTPTVIAVRGLQNRPSELSHPTDQFGSSAPVREGDVFVMPVIVTRSAPKFAATSKPKGSITLEAVITPDGRVTNVRVLDSPDSAYNVRAIEAYREYHFKPATLNGQPTYATYRETMVFSRPGPM